MQGPSVLLVAISLLSWWVPQVFAEDQFLPPSPCSNVPSTPGDPPTLDSVLQEAANQREGGDVVYHLQAGEHCVKSFSLVKNFTGFILQGDGNAVIRCRENMGLAFFNVSLRLLNITIDSCGLGFDHIQFFITTVRESIDYFFELSTNLEDQYVALMLGDCADVAMENCMIINTDGLGLLGINVRGESSLNNVTFQRNIGNLCFSPGFDFSRESIGGGAIFSFHDYIDEDNKMHRSSQLEIVDSYFIENSYCGFAALSAYYYRLDQGNEPVPLSIGGGGGLSLITAAFGYSVDVAIRGSTFRNNTAIYGCGLMVWFYTGILRSLVTLDNCIFESNGIEPNPLAGSNDTVVVGSALAMVRDYVQPGFNLQEISRNYSSSTMVVRNSTFTRNACFTGTAFITSYFNFVLSNFSQSQVIFEGCRFESNFAVTAAGLYLQEWKRTIIQSGMDVILKDVTIQNNTLFRNNGVQSPLTRPAIIVTDSINMTFDGTNSIAHNLGTAVTSSNSNLYFLGNTTFLNNSGAYGGALNLDSSQVILDTNATLKFKGNTGAVLGGAIYVLFTLNTLSITPQDCFIYFGPFSYYCFSIYNFNCTDVTQFGAKIIFEDNSAPLGNMIYGSTLNTCPWAITFRDMYAPERDSTNLLELFYDIQDEIDSPFQFDVPPNTTSAVSTSTAKIVVKSVEDDEEKSLTEPLSVAPGITHLLKVTTLDAFGQEVPTVITSLSLTPDVKSQVGETGYTFLDLSSFDYTEFTVRGAENQSDVDVTLFAVQTFTQQNLTIEITACPDGYYFNPNESSCQCNSRLTDMDFNCTDEGEILVPFRSWVGEGPDGDLTVGPCPFDYCNPEIAIVTTYQSNTSSVRRRGYDVQCNDAFNRSGVACGSCVEGYSAIFGSNRCKKCSNLYLLLIIPLFALYGIVLIFAIAFLQFTVSAGFVNGLLFFSNILSIVVYTFYTRGSAYFAIFFWLSLKVGFEVCFYDGMTALASAGLEFVFPLYLFSLVLLITVLSQRSTRFSRFLGSHGSPAKLFATLLVITYSRLLETCISILSFATLHKVDSDETLLQWRYDLSIGYFSGLHGFLGVVSVLLLTFFLIPAPLTWMFPGLIYKFAFLRRYLPIFDAVWAPLKTQYRFLVSFRLILRIFPLVILNFAPVPTNILGLCIFFLFILFGFSMLQPFKGRAQNILDSLFQVNLILILLLVLYFTILSLRVNQEIYDVDAAIRSNDIINELSRDEEGLIYYSIVNAYFPFLIVMVMHLFLRFPKLKEKCVCAWNAVACKPCQLQGPRSREKERSPRPTSIVSSGVVLDYDTTATVSDYASIQQSTDKSTTPKVVTTFSELREPLLDESSGFIVHQPVDTTTP